MCDYFLLGNLKALVYVHKLRTLDDLKEAIRVEFAQFDRAMVGSVVANFHEHFQKCINENEYMMDIVFHT